VFVFINVLDFNDNTLDGVKLFLFSDKLKMCVMTSRGNNSNQSHLYLNLFCFCCFKDSYYICGNFLNSETMKNISYKTIQYIYKIASLTFINVLTLNYICFLDLFCISLSIDRLYAITFTVSKYMIAGFYCTTLHS
jgi:hypothetical protein